MQNQAQSSEISYKDQILKVNQTSVVNKAPSSVKNQTQSSEMSVEDQNLKANQSAAPASKSTNSSSLVKDGVASNDSASLAKKQGNDGKKQRNGNDARVVVKQGNEGWIDGEWVHICLKI